MERAQKQGATDQSQAKSDDHKKHEARIAELEAAQLQMIEQLKKMQENAPPADPQETFGRAKNQYEAGNFEGAAQTFSAYLKAPNGKKTEEATYLRAESYFNLKDFKKAIVDYSKFPEKFTRSSHMPQALYKIGLSFEALGMKEDARSFYAELAEKFPKSAEAKKVKAKLR